MKTVLLILIAAFAFTAGADEAPAIDTPADAGPHSYRSTPDKHFWVSAHAGAQAGWWGVDSGGGVGGQTGIAARVQFGRCSVEATWDRQNMEYTQPDPFTEMNVYGLGAACRVNFGGEKYRFWKGGHLLAHALVDYATERYDIYDDYHKSWIASGKTYAMGGQLIADVMVPIYVGFYGYVGLSYEFENYRYNIPANSLDVHDTGGWAGNIIGRIGLAYGFL